MIKLHSSQIRGPSTNILQELGTAEGRASLTGLRLAGLGETTTKVRTSTEEKRREMKETRIPELLLHLVTI